MNRHSFLIAVLFLGLLFGCSNDGDDAPTPTKLVDKSGNLLGTGDSANDLLSNDAFTKILIEIGYVEGFRPTTSAMAELTDYIKLHTFKQDIEVVYNELTSPNVDSLTLQKIADLETENRTAYNNGQTMAVYIYFADAPSDDDVEEEGLVTLGAVYRNTSMVIHEVTVRKLASQSPLITIPSVEAATMNHEFGHLFGLVNLGTTPVNDHEEVDSGNHCSVSGCLMRAELQFGGIQNKASALNDKSSTNAIVAGCTLSGNSILKLLEHQTAKGVAASPALDSECILDLQANGGR